MNPKIIAIAATTLVVCGPTLLKAEDNAERFYVHADVGTVFIQDLTIHLSVPGQPIPERLDTHFHPGARGDIAIGYNLCDSLAVEVETGALWNRVNSYNGFSTGSSTDLYQIPLLGNLIYRIHLKHGWTPYLSSGAGADFSVFKTEVFRGVTEANDSGDDVAFGYQAKAGISYAISPNASLDFAYAFFGSLGHDWNIDGFSYKSDNIYTHAILLSFCWKF